ncbi:C-C motif chemokine 1 [Eptesicus fuscus]|uniref:C-C motif chemokine 1 n=1 Tax=Eptesicus fuscus TaxID=29078 RepID=UPI002403B39A|nr:C-C motif chemokine 1 [Eptesicus fuscus]
MKLSTTALVCLLLLVGTWLQDGDSWSLHVPSSNCCFTIVRKAISLKGIQCYRNPSSSCSHQDRIIFKMKGGKKSCALKTDKWVTDNLRKIKPCLPTEM